MKKLMIAMICLLCAGCSVSSNGSQPTSTPSANKGCDVMSVCGDTQADMSGYENFMDSDHAFVSTTFDEALTAMEEKKTFVLYVGFATCPWCLEAMPLLNEAAKEAGASVSYINVRPDNTKESDLRVSDNPDYVRFVDVMSEVLSTNDEGEKHLYVPFVFFIKNGEVAAWHEDTFPEHDAHERTMTEEESERLLQIYRDGFALLMQE